MKPFLIYFLIYYIDLNIINFLKMGLCDPATGGASRARAAASSSQDASKFSKFFQGFPTSNPRQTTILGRCKNQRILLENKDFKTVHLFGFNKLQEASKMPPRGSKSVRRPPKTLPKRPKTAPKSLQDAPRDPKMLPRGSRMPHDSPNDKQGAL